MMLAEGKGFKGVRGTQFVDGSKMPYLPWARWNAYP